MAKVSDLQDDLDAPFPEARSEGDSWAISYADLVTILLCFFIIFFNVDKFKLNVPVIDKTRLVESPVNETTEIVVPKIIEDITKSFKSRSDILTQSKGEQVFVQFREVSFFDKGSTSLTFEGRNKVDEFFASVEMYKEGLTIDIQGHADSTPVRVDSVQRKFQDNIELSTLRSIAVYRYLSEKGLAPNQMSVSGYGDLATPIGSKVLGPIDPDQLRRVTFLIKVRPVEN